MLKQYKIGAYIYQYTEGKQPEGAVEYIPDNKEDAGAKVPAKRAPRAPANKAKAVGNK